MWGGVILTADNHSVYQTICEQNWDLDKFYVKNVKFKEDIVKGINMLAIYGYHDMKQVALRKSQGIDNSFYALHTHVPSVRASDIGENCGIKRFLKSLGISYEVPDDRQRIFDIGNMIEEEMIGKGEILLYVDHSGQFLLNGESSFSEYIDQYEVLTDTPIQKGRWYMAKIKQQSQISWLAKDRWIFKHNYGDKEGFIYVLYDQEGKGGVITGHYDFLLLKPSNWEEIIRGEEAEPRYTGEENEWILCDVKTMNSRVFSRICASDITQEKPEYDMQTLLYSTALPKKMNVTGRAIFAFNKGAKSDAVDQSAFENNEYYIFPFANYRNIEEIVFRAYSTLTKTSPVNIDLEKDMNTQYCNWCDYKEDCMNVLMHMEMPEEAIDPRYRRQTQESLFSQLKKHLHLLSHSKGDQIDLSLLIEQMTPEKTIHEHIVLNR